MLCVLLGSRGATRDFVQRLRTQYVDVDRAGRACRERQATVELQRGVGAAGAAVDAQRVLTGWAACDCEDEARLRATLVELGLSEEDVAQLVGSSTGKKK